MNCGELLRWTVCSTCINFLVLYLKDSNKKLDQLTEDLTRIADKQALDLGKLPGGDITQWKLSTQDFARWVKWSDEQQIRSCLDRESCISDLFVMNPELDRLLNFAVRRFSNAKEHLLFTGPSSSGKTSVVKVSF